MNAIREEILKMSVDLSCIQGSKKSGHDKDCIFGVSSKCPIKDHLGDVDIQIGYLSALEEIKNVCAGAIIFEQSRGLSIFQY